MGPVLKLPAFRRLLVAYALNELAFGVGSLALALLVLQRTGSALGASAYFLCSQFVPAVIAPALIVRLERVGPGRLLPLLYGGEAVAFAALAALTSGFSLAPALALIILDGALALTARTLARAASVAVCAPAGRLRDGNALLNGAFSLCYVAGPALGGVLAAAGGLRLALEVAAGTFVVVALVLGAGLPGIAAGQGGGEADGGSRRRLWAALSYIQGAAGVRALMMLQGVAILAFTIALPVEVLLAERTLHGGSGGYGALLSAWGAGAVLGSLLYARLRAKAPHRLIAGGAGALALGFGTMAAAPGLAVAIVGSAVAGAGNGIEVVAARTGLQELVPENWMTVVLSFGESVAAAVPGAGILLGGGLAALFGVRVALAAGGAAALGVALVALRNAPAA